MKEKKIKLEKIIIRKNKNYQERKGKNDDRKSGNNIVKIFSKKVGKTEGI